MSETETTLGPIPGPRLARLFAQAGLIAEADWVPYAKQNQKYVSLGDVLFKDAFSIGTFHDLFFRAEINPFKSRKSSTTKPREIMVTVEVDEKNLAEILKLHQPKPEQIEALLEATGIVEIGTITQGAEQAMAAGQEPYGWIVRNGLLTPKHIKQFLAAPENPLAVACPLRQVLEVLRINGVLGAEDHARLAAELDAAEQGGGLGSVQQGVLKTTGLSSAELLELAGTKLRIEQRHLAAADLNEGAMKLLPREFLSRQAIIPLGREDHSIRIAASDPLDASLSMFVRLCTGLWLHPVFVPADTLQDLLHDYFQPDEPRQETVRPLPPVAPPAAPPPAPAATKSGKPVKAPKKSGTPAAAAQPVSLGLDLAQANFPVDSVSAVQLVNSIVSSAIELNATDIHLEPRREAMAVRFRIDGQLTVIVNIPQNLVGPVTSRFKVLASMDVTERRRPQDGHINLAMSDRNIDFRIATLPTVYGEKVAIRILDSSRVMTGLSQLGLTAKQLTVAERLIKQPYGMNLVTGPTGSGKTSTLYAALTELNQDSRHLVTIEDPVEYQLPGINQVQVDPNLNLTFSEGLRAILRQDPNVIMVGEIRDGDTAKTAIRAALTGHLVFSTLHTNSALGAFQALANLGATPYLIGSAVSGVLAQRLVRVLCKECRKAEPVSKALAAQLKVRLGKTIPKWYRAKGCPTCLGSGYSGRIGIFEVLEMTEPLRKAVLNDDSPDRLEKIADAEGRIGIREAGLEKVKAGITSPEELVEKVILEG